jgi:hypothetical protein
MKPNSTYIAGRATARQDSDGASQIEFRQMGFVEYQSLPSIVPLLVKFDRDEQDLL